MRLCRASVVLLSAIVACSSASADGIPTDNGQPIDAIWKVRSVTFRFGSPTTYYYCDTLQRRVAEILLQVGANELMDVKAKCSVGPLINTTTIRVVVGVPVEATRANLVAETTFDRRTVLIAEARNWTLATPETVHRFRAVHTDVSFANMAPSDCELLKAMSTQVFPQLGIELKNALVCTGAQPAINLTVRALKAIPLE